MTRPGRYSWLALGICGLAIASVLDAAPDEQSLRLRLGKHQLRSLRIACTGEGYHSGAEWDFSQTHRPREVEHNFQAAEGNYVCELTLNTNLLSRSVSRRVELSGGTVTLPLEHELRELRE